MRVRLVLRLRGSRSKNTPPADDAVNAVLAGHDAELSAVLQSAADAIDLLVFVPATADLDQIAADVARGTDFTDATSEWAPASKVEPWSQLPRGAGGEGFTCDECGGVDGDHYPGCKRAAEAAT